MEKEMLLSKKEQLISNKQKLEENNCRIEFLEKENEDLEIKYIQITESLDSLDKIVYKYETLEEAKKIYKICLPITILGSIVVGVVSNLGIFSNNIFEFILTSIYTFIVSNILAAFPYFVSKQSLKILTNLSLEEVQEQIDEKNKEKSLNRQRINKNIRELEILNTNNAVINNFLYEMTNNLLNDKEAREEIMTEIMEVEPSKELVQSITDSMLKRNKVKLKTKKEQCQLKK